MLCFCSLATHFLKKVLVATIHYGNNMKLELYINMVTVGPFFVGRVFSKTKAEKRKYAMI